MSLPDIHASLEKAQGALLALQRADGHFEGLLSSNTYPSCASAILHHLRGEPPDPSLLTWLLEQQADSGLWRLDPSARTDPEATCLARLVLKLAHRQMYDSALGQEIESALRRTPPIASHLWIVKLFEALCGERAWSDLLPPRHVKWLMGAAQRLMPLLPRTLLRRAKPPTQYAPPPDLFGTAAFRRLFIAEQHTIVPLALILESHTTGRRALMRSLLDWMLTHQLADGSWFRVHFITAISALALLEARREGMTQHPMEPTLAWLEATRNPDGGYREAINLNVWDTALSVLALLAAGTPADVLRRAGEWLLAHQNPDGGWPFSGFPAGGLPSDADDTALATLALLRLGYPPGHPGVERGLRWLRSHQGKDGSWSTYVPGAGDVGCVSVTAHAVEALLQGEHPSDAVQRAIRWLKRVQHPEGYWEDLWLAQRTYGTASAILALVKAGERESEAVRRGMRWLEGIQQTDGGWGEDMQGQPMASTAEQTAWSSYALWLAEPGNAAAQRGLRLLRETQREDGTWEPACVGIYWEVIGGYADPVYALVFPMLALNAALP